MSSLRLLHLEDDSADAALVAATLEADGLRAQIRRVDNGGAFEDALHVQRYDVILADYNLPSFDGLSAQNLASKVQPDTPFIFLSGSIGEELAIERLKGGATDYVLKDRMARLPSAIRRALAETAERIERRRAEDDVRRLNVELEQRVIERTKELALAQLEAERANRAKSEFLSRMSHDLRTPLNAVLGFAQLLDGASLPDEYQEHVHQILRGGRHLLELINEVLDIARIEAGHLSLSPEPISAMSVVRPTIELVQPLAARRGIVTDVIAPESGDVIVRADRQRLTQVVMNLVSNAIKYNRTNGRVTIQFHARPDDRVRISITDTGAGIPPGKLALLFQPFERLGAEYTGVEGTGLGLALARGLAEAMGGSLGVDSRVDEGSTFWIELAVTAAPDTTGVMAAIETASDETSAETAGVVLYVEDNVSNIRLMQRVFERRPAVSLVHAANGREGLRLARELRPDLIFLDMHLPDITGETVLEKLWQDSTLRRIPVAILSADAMPAQARRLQAAGAIAYLTKPLEIVSLLRLLDTRLRGVRQS